MPEVAGHLCRDDSAVDEPSELNVLMASVASRSCRRSFERLYALTNRQLFGIILRILPDRAAAEETLQQTYLTAWRQRVSFAVGGDSLVNLVTIARDLAMARRLGSEARLQTPAMPASRDHRTSRDAPSPLATEAPPHPADAHGLDQSLQGWMGGLSHEQRSSFNLALRDGLAPREIAQRLGCSPSTVRGWIRQSLLNWPD